MVCPCLKLTACYNKYQGFREQFVCLFVCLLSCLLAYINQPFLIAVHGLLQTWLCVNRSWIFWLCDSDSVFFSHCLTRYPVFIILSLGHLGNSSVRLASNQTSLIIRKECLDVEGWWLHSGLRSRKASRNQREYINVSQTAMTTTSNLVGDVFNVVSFAIELCFVGLLTTWRSGKLSTWRSVHPQPQSVDDRRRISLMFSSAMWWYVMFHGFLNAQKTVSLFLNVSLYDCCFSNWISWHYQFFIKFFYLFDVVYIYGLSYSSLAQGEVRLKLLFSGPGSRVPDEDGKCNQTPWGVGEDGYGNSEEEFQESQITSNHQITGRSTTGIETLHIAMGKSWKFDESQGFLIDIWGAKQAYSPRNLARFWESCQAAKQRLQRPRTSQRHLWWQRQVHLHNHRGELPSCRVAVVKGEITRLCRHQKYLEVFSWFSQSLCGSLSEISKTANSSEWSAEALNRRWQQLLLGWRKRAESIALSMPWQFKDSWEQILRKNS